MTPDPSPSPTVITREDGAHDPGLGEARNCGCVVVGWGVGGGGRITQEGWEGGPARLTVVEWVLVLLGAAT